MNELEIRAAASSASERRGYERIEFIHNSYPKEHWAEILVLADKLRNENEFICKYNIERR